MAKHVLLGLLLPILLAGCSCRKDSGPPAPNAADAPGWSQATKTASGQVSSTAAHTPEDHLPQGLGHVPLSQGPAMYGLPLDIEIRDVPEVPSNIRNPTTKAGK